MYNNNQRKGMPTKGKVKLETKYVMGVTPKGEAAWCKYNEVDNYGKYSVDLYLNEQDTMEFGEFLENLRAQVVSEIQEKGLNIKEVAPVEKVNKEGKTYFQFKIEPEYVDINGQYTTIPIFDVKGVEITNTFRQLVGNGSIVKVGFLASPYYVTGKVGISLKFKKLQIIKLNEYSNQAASGFEDESEGYSQPAPQYVNKFAASGGDFGEEVDF